MPTTARRTARVLILSEHSLLAALLGMLLELESFEPAFAEPGESPEDALARIKPLMVILLDGEMDAAGSDLFFARAGRRGVRVVLFRPPGSRVDVAAIADARSLDWISLPVDRATLARLVGDGTSSTRTEGDRRAGEPSTAPIGDGGLIYRDRNGHQWFVYDRRAGPRRAEDREGVMPHPADEYRVFVNERGEEWRIALTEPGWMETTPDALERQLAQAVRVFPEAR